MTPDYFKTLGIAIIAGRGCSISDDPGPAPAVIINRRLARHLFGETNPLERQVRFVEGGRPPMAIVGVSADAIYNSVREEPRDFLYLCRVQSQSSRVDGVLLVRSMNAHADHLTLPVQRLIQSVDPDVQISSIRTLQQYLTDSLYADNLIAGLLSGLTMIALVIASVGLYGVVAATVARQTAEIGLRIALGADAWRIVKFVAGPVMKVTAVGLVLGAAGALVSSSMLASLLFGLNGADPLTYIAVVVVLAATTAVACCVPAQRAMRIDPVAALRGD